jgi:hypothetical protein
VRGCILPVDELFARVREHGAPFESDPEDEDYRLEENSPVTEVSVDVRRVCIGALQVDICIAVCDW